jgi:hypothetical protein
MARGLSCISGGNRPRERGNRFFRDRARPKSRRRTRVPGMSPGKVEGTFERPFPGGERPQMGQVLPHASGMHSLNVARLRSAARDGGFNGSMQ